MTLISSFLSRKGAIFSFRRLFSKPTVNWQAENFYDRLGVKKDATQADIKSRYHEIARAYHPDVLHDPEEKKEGEKVMSLVNAAYDVLKDEKSRHQYDQQSSASPFPFTTGGSYGGPRHYRPPHSQQQPPQVFREMVHLSFEESVFGCKRIVTLQTTKSCQKCNGNGTHDGKPPEICPHCNGQGVLLNGFFMSSCPYCEGRGIIINKHCNQCKGTGQVPNPTKITLDIPAGVENGNVLSFATQQGNIFVVCQVKEDPLLTREGNDLHITVPLSIKTAILGGVVQIPTLKGVLNKKVLPGTQPNNVERLDGAGIGNGNLYIHYKLILPRSLSRKDRKMFENLDEKYMNSANDMWNSNLNSFQTRIQPFQKK